MDDFSPPLPQGLVQLYLFITSMYDCRLLSVNEWYNKQQYNLISCLNVLDRCERPYQLLQQIHQSLKPEGLAVIAVVLPFESYVESGTAYLQLF